MNSGVEILIERAKTNPEEFAYKGKWVDMVKMYRQYMTEKDRLALEAAISEGLMGEFTELVLKGLAGEPIKMHETMAHRCSTDYVKQKEKEEADLRELRMMQQQMGLSQQYSGSMLRVGVANNDMNSLLGGQAMAMNQANQANQMYQLAGQSSQYDHANMTMLTDPFTAEPKKTKPELTTISKVKAIMNKMRRDE